MTHPIATITSPQGAEALETKEEKTELSASSAGDKVILLPCRNPPSRERVQLWLEARKQYDILEKDKRETGKERDKADVEQETPDRTEPPVVSRCPSVNKEHCGNISSMRTQRRKKLNLSLVLSPLLNSGCQSKSTEVSPVSDESSEGLEPEEKEDDDSFKTVSPESPDLPPWQESHQLSPSAPDRLSNRKPCENSPEPLSPRLSNSQERLGGDTSPSPFHGIHRDGESNSSHYLHSTPFLRKRRRSTEDLDPVCSTPLSDSKNIKDPVSPRLQQRRRSQADPLRRVLLTTQMKNQFAAINVPKKEQSQIEGPSIANSYGFKVSMQNLQDAKALHEVQHLTLMGMELHARSRRDLEPDPEFDPICALFYCFSSDAPLQGADSTQLTGAIMVDKDYESCGQGDSKENRFAAERDEYGADTMTEINIIGRVTLNLWRVMKSEAGFSAWPLHTFLSAPNSLYSGFCDLSVYIPQLFQAKFLLTFRINVTLNNYSFENVAFHVLHQRFPLYSPRSLSDWFDHITDLYRWKMVDHYVSRLHGTMQLLQQQDIIGRTSELARLFGIQFLHVLTRGSQSMMLRVAKPLNYIPVTPSMQQRAQQRAPQCIPLVMEPESRFYSNSVVVLDFQSLYPSIVIAYNYCFSTCLGHMDSLGT
ncbi:hypothetical protein XENOCAPTIV_027189 [Xenoophorus captivus]|uniref:DNA-directed DNA polymerase n=1 Tax=Xenoophorus captivus TaxID=1517983 RepID=A0ABV0Q6E0_9TELE